MTAPRYAPDLDFPAYRHRPGRTPHPRTAAAGHSHTQPEPSCPPLTPASMRWHQAWRFGIDLFNHGYWWEAHEQWEAAWRVTEAPATRHLLQGLIQVAAALLKWEAGNARGRRRLWQRARANLEAVPVEAAADLGIDLPALRQQLDPAFAGADAASDDPGPVPEVRLRLRLA